MIPRFHWIASYPKSGNTWLRLMLESVSRSGAPIDFTRRGSLTRLAAHRQSLDHYCDVQSGDLTEDEAMALRPDLYAEQAAEATGPLLRKVHDAWTPAADGRPLFPPALTLGAIYLVRDPRDVAVSFAHHSGTSVDRAVAVMSDPEAALSDRPGSSRAQMRQRLLTWSGHVESWLGAQPTPMLLRYEDMTDDPKRALSAVVAHLGWDHDEDTLARAVAATAFERLRNAEETHGFLEGAPGRTFFRRGIAQGWRDSLTREQAAQIENDHGEMMARLGYR